ncbi:excinuclease ABC subunit A [Roseovarius sp.]|uniref:excinuclease ABC subunit A n=1 Tax=Roseovarius sp. TaxID=1486281 RepID=UPI0025E4BF5B|nr:excinuclease ABC subunit A [Roseovarius sp.]
MKYLYVMVVALMALSPAGQASADQKPKIGHCPPGLAKKNPPCVPPGLAKNNYRVGDRYYLDDYLSDHDRRRHGLPRLPYGQSYYRVGDSLIRVDNETREVLELIEAVSRVLD